MPLSDSDGSLLVSISRKALESFVTSGKVQRESSKRALLRERFGVFVTLHGTSGGERFQRGCIGFPYPVHPLGRATVEATVAAASRDPRFTPVKPEELGTILVEVSVLTEPAKVHASRRTELPYLVRVGVDGLIVSSRTSSGLLLPIVAVEHKLSASDLLTEACLKAGLAPDAWLTDGVEVKTFQAEVFSELEPRGRAVRVRY